MPCPKEPLRPKRRPASKPGASTWSTSGPPTTSSCSAWRMYNDDPRFKANYDKIHPNLAEFMREAVKVYVKNHR